MSDQLTANAVFESLTGFDEIAIAQRFGRTVTDLASNDSSMFTRALLFVLKRRDGANDDDAWNHALNLPMKEVTAFVEAGADDESGKAQDPEPEPAPQLESSLTSA